MSYQNELNQNVETGNLKISEDVIASIAKIAAKEVEGVAELTTVPANLKGVFKSKPVKTPVIVNLNDEVVVIDIYLKLKYGAKVQSVSAEVQKKIKDSVQNMTSIAVSKVNIHITSIALENKNN